MNKFKLKLRQRDIPKSDLIIDMQRVAEHLGKQTITKTDYDQYGNFGATTILRKFDKWNKALSTAGLTLNNRLNIPDEELFENLANAWQTLGRQPVGKDLSKALGISLFSLATYEKRFNSWNKALVAFIQYIENPSSEAPINKTDFKNLPSNLSKRTPRQINWRLRATVLIRDNCICRMCGASPAKDPSVSLHADHIKPWSKGGETALENLQTLCSVCNIGKSNAL